MQKRWKRCFCRHKLNLSINPPSFDKEERGRFFERFCVSYLCWFLTGCSVLAGRCQNKIMQPCKKDVFRDDKNRECYKAHRVRRCFSLNKAYSSRY